MVKQDKKRRVRQPERTEKKALTSRKKGTGKTKDAVEKTKSESISRQTSRKQVETLPPLFAWPFSLINYILFGTSLMVIIVGYVFLNTGTHDSFTSLTIGPILLVFGYLIMIPVSILFPSHKVVKKQVITE